MNSHQLIYDNFAQVLHFGTPYIFNDVISINQETLEKTGGFVDIMLSFGGRKSPAKSSTYKLDFTKKIQMDHPELLIVNSEENILFSDLKQKLTNPDAAMAFFKSN